MKYGIIGIRDYNHKIYDNRDYIFDVLNNFSDVSGIISGGSKGIEKIVEDWAAENDISVRIVLPNIQQHGKEAAFIVRNDNILAQSEACIVFWDGFNKAIAQFMKNAMLQKKEVSLIPVV